MYPATFGNEEETGLKLGDDDDDECLSFSDQTLVWSKLPIYGQRSSVNSVSSTTAKIQKNYT